VGIVDHGNPIPTSRIASDLKRSREATLVNLERLEAGNYISRSAAVGHAYSYRIRIPASGTLGLNSYCRIFGISARNRNVTPVILYLSANAAMLKL
jgi:hypothetical protein